MSTLPSTFVFVRHGDSLANHLGQLARQKKGYVSRLAPLTTFGERQVALTGEWLRTHFPNPDKIFASPYMRAQQTALAAYPHQQIVDDVCLEEHKRGTMLEGLVHVDGETEQDVQVRIRLFLDRLSRECGGKTVVVFGHSYWFLLFQLLVPEWHTTKCTSTSVHLIECASVSIYRRDTDASLEVPRLVHDKAEDYEVPWKDKL